jgi:prepilin-type N-terminal cleavage/methylation domain-containing protein
MNNAARVTPRVARRAIRAFTLIELLVVVAILGILVAVMFPALGRARNEALGSKSLGRMRILGAGYALYMAETGTVPLDASKESNERNAASEWTIQTAIAPYLDLPETGNARFASPVWWDAFAEINGFRTNSGGGCLYYPSPPAWPGGPPRNQLVGPYFDYNAFTTYVGEDGATNKGFDRLNQIAKPSKTALLFSRRLDTKGGSVDWNVWADGRKFSSTNPPSYGAKRFVFYFDGHTDTQIINATNYNASGLFNWTNQ